MKRKVWESKSTGQLCVTIPKDSGIKAGEIVSVSAQEIKKVVFSTIVGDLFHYGHLQLLENAKKLGDYHICGVQTNKAIKEYRKEPISNFKERRAVISNLKCVDKVVPQDSNDPTNNLRQIHLEFPEAEIILVHGTNWKDIPGSEYIKKIGGKVIKFPYYNRLSDFNIINKIIKDYKEKFEQLQILSQNKKHDLISTKATTLKSLHKILTKSNIEKPFIFSVEEWTQNPQKILKSITEKFSPRKIVVRSSALNEDTMTESKAGVYTSVIDVNSLEAEQIKNSINKVINSYITKGTPDKLNQVLIQKKVEDVIISGVILTRENENGAPYYIINYDDRTGSTNSVTSGTENKIIKISYFADRENLQKWEKLIDAVSEAEKGIPNVPLDIEFAFTKDE